MAALTANRPTQRMGPNETIPNRLSIPVAATAHIFEGALVAVVGGYAQPSTGTTGEIIVGRAEAEADNSGTGTNPGAGNGAAGNIAVEVRQGCYKWNNSSGADAIAAANVGQTVFSVDDNTVALTDGNNSGATRSPAGRVVQVDSDGVWVDTIVAGVDSTYQKGSVISIPVSLPEIAAGQLVGPFKPGFKGRIVSAQVIITTPATTAGKAATLQPQITPSGGAAASTTGGAIALTSANCTPLGADVAGTPITGANSFGAADSIGVVASAVTAFAEGAGVLLISLA